MLHAEQADEDHGHRGSHHERHPLHRRDPELRQVAPVAAQIPELPHLLEKQRKDGLLCLGRGLEVIERLRQRQRRSPRLDAHPGLIHQRPLEIDHALGIGAAEVADPRALRLRESVGENENVGQAVRLGLGLVDRPLEADHGIDDDETEQNRIQRGVVRRAANRASRPDPGSRGVRRPPAIARWPRRSCPSRRHRPARTSARGLAKARRGRA